jgi:hypothetical protein
MRIPLAIIAGALLIAASILIVGRYSVGHVAVGSRGYTVFGVDSWTGEPFRQTTIYPRLPVDQK